MQADSLQAKLEGAYQKGWQIVGELKKEGFCWKEEADKRAKRREKEQGELLLTRRAEYHGLARGYLVRLA